MIFMSMGGNDVEFSTVLENCARVGPNSMGDCQAHWDSPSLQETLRAATAGEDPRSRSQVEMDQLEDNLRTTWMCLREQSGDGAHIVHMGYPPLFDESYGGIASVLTNEDAMWVNERGRELNDMMARVAAEEGVHFIDPTEAFAGHSIGSDDPWILSYAHWNMGGPHRAAAPEAFHPNAEGQAAMQREVEKYLAGLP